MLSSLLLWGGAALCGQSQPESSKSPDGRWVGEAKHPGPTDQAKTIHVAFVAPVAWNVLPLLTLRLSTEAPKKTNAHEGKSSFLRKVFFRFFSFLASQKMKKQNEKSKSTNFLKKTEVKPP